MTLAIATSPAIVNTLTTSDNDVVTASFTPTASSLLVAVAIAGISTATPTCVFTDSLGGTWTNRASANTNGTGYRGGVYVGTRVISASPAAMTVTATWTAAGGTDGTNLAVYVITGADNTTPVGGTATNVFTTDTTTFTRSLTTTVTGSLVIGGVGRTAIGDTASLASNTAWPPMSGTNPIADGSSGSCRAVFKASGNTGTPGALTYGVTFPGAAKGHYAAVEILPAGNSTIVTNDPSNIAADTAIARATVPAADTSAAPGADTATASNQAGAADPANAAVDVAGTVKVQAIGETGSFDDATKVIADGAILGFGTDVGGSVENAAVKVSAPDTAATTEVAFVGYQGAVPPGPRVIRILSSS